MTKNVRTDGRVLESMLLISEQMETTLYYNYYLGKILSCAIPKFKCNYNKIDSIFYVSNQMVLEEIHLKMHLNHINSSVAFPQVPKLW